MDTLDQIAIEATGLESDQEAAQAAILGQGQGEAQPAIDPAQAWAAIPKMFGGILSLAIPGIDDAVYTDDRCYKWGDSMSKVANKYGWDAAETFEKFGPEIALVMATLPLAIPTFKAIQHLRKEEARTVEAEETQRGQVEPVPGAGNVAE